MSLVCENISFSYKNKNALENISLNLFPSEVIALVGRNGSGKSTLIKNIAGIVKPKLGDIKIFEKSIDKYSNKEKAKLISYMPQKHILLVQVNVLESVMLGRMPHLSFKPTDEDFYIVENIINKLGLKDYLFKKVYNLSGGEFQKVMLARVLTQDPKILLLDEPVNHLDPKNQLEVLHIIKDFTKSKNLITIVVLHDINLALRFADKIVMLKDGKLMGIKNKDDITENEISELFDVNVKILKTDDIVYSYFS